MNFRWKISKRAAALHPSATLVIDAKAKELRKKGEDVINFSAGEPDFDTPAPIAEAGIQAIRSGKTRYTPAAGVPELREAIAQKFKRDNGLDYSPSEVMATAGAKQALHDAFQVLVSDGDEVIVPSPYWVSFTELITLSGGKPVIVPTEENNHPSIDRIRKALTPRTVGILVNSPNNPTGAVCTRKEIEDIAQLAIEKNLWILSDEVYEKLTFGGAKHSSPAQVSPQAKAQTIIVNAASKSFAMTGWRLGYLAGPREFIAAAENIQVHATGNPSSPAQYAALAALQSDGKTLEEWVREYDKRRLAIIKLLGEIPGFRCPTPEGAFYAFPDVSGVFNKKWKNEPIANSMRLAQLLLEEAKVALVPGSAFGKEGYLRISYATSMKQIEEGLRRIKQFIQDCG